MEATRKESGSLAYAYSVIADHTVVHIYESHRDSQAVVTHVHDTFSEFSEDFIVLVAIEGIVLYGSPQPAAKEILDGFGSVYMTPFVGLTQAPVEVSLSWWVGRPHPGARPSPARTGSGCR